MRIGKSLLLVIPMVLAGCVLNEPSSQTTVPTGSNTTSTTSQEPTSTTTTTTTTTVPVIEDPFPAPEQITIDTSGFNEEAIPVNVTMINDFHGQIDEKEDDYKVGLAKLSTYLKQRKRAGDLLIDNGDMYQGSFLCNYDRGQFVSYAFKHINFDAHVIGNHEFDWSDQYIFKNEECLGQKLLGANVYKYPKQNDEWVKSPLGEEYKIINMYEGTPYEVKVGVVGVIGKSQITSITSTLAADYVFLDPTDIVKSTAMKLRNQLDCDIVIAAYHDAEPDQSIADNMPDTDKPYVDMCFKAHTHKFQYSLYNDVPFIQAGAYSRGAAGVNLTFNKLTGVTTRVDSGYRYLNTLDLEADPIMVERINAEKEKNKSKYEDIIGYNDSGDEMDYDAMSRYYAKLSYDKAIVEAPQFDIVGAMFNESRTSLKAGAFTYADLFETHPFLNGIYVFSVSGSNLNNEIGYSYGYLKPGVTTFEDDEYYDILLFDYNGMHIGINSNYEKYYNYFSSAFSVNAKHEPYKLSFNCFELALQKLETNPHIVQSDFSGEGFFSRTK